jgi:hypothetical protein
MDDPTTATFVLHYFCDGLGLLASKKPLVLGLTNALGMSGHMNSCERRE